VCLSKTFIPFIIEQLRIPVDECCARATKLVTVFAQSMTFFFNERTKDKIELDEKTFIIPRNMNWQRIYNEYFGQLFTLGMDSILPSNFVKDTKAITRRDENTYLQFVRETLATSPLEAIVRFKKFIAENIAIIVWSELQDKFTQKGFSLFLKSFASVFADEELAEFVFVTYGCCLYLLQIEGVRKLKITNPMWLAICREGHSWAADLLISFTSPLSVRATDEETGDSIFPLLAEEGNLHLLQEIIGYGHLPVAVDKYGQRQRFCENNSKQLFFDCIEDPEDREFFRDHFSVWNSDLHNNTPYRRQFRVLKPPSEEKKSDPQELGIIRNLQNDAREDALN
jgi:hypothetical protein